jgi:type II secretory ATPase GspE/PulE/Tfp pilus assembly ATPase PilB-like protein
MTQFNDTSINARLDILHHAEEERLVQSFAPKNGYAYVNLHDVQVNSEAVKLISEAESHQGELVIFAIEKQQISVAIRNPKNLYFSAIIEKLKSMGYIPTLYLASQWSVAYGWEFYKTVEKAAAQTRGVFSIDPLLMKRFFAETKSTNQVSEELLTLQKENDVTKTSKMLTVIFGGALALKTSDVHIEPEVANTRIRYRIDGVLVDVCSIDSDSGVHIMSRLKLLSGLKLNIHKEAQDGRFTFDIESREVEVRSSIIPGAFGESIVMRLLDPSASSFTIEKLGLNKKLHDIVLEELKRPHGALITTGPTGSGKTSALYSFLLAIHTPELKIITLEDPVEYKLPGIVQTQISSTYSFAEGLRSILRQDPDAILVGEIRDREVAETTVHAALTGHLVFSTLHTNSAAGAFARLIDLGIDGRMIGSAFNIILGQRLVRILCNECKVEREITTTEQVLLQKILETPLAIHTMFEAKGCDACSHTGYRGRVGVFEAILLDEAVQNAIVTDTRESYIQEAAKPQGIPTMQQDGVMKVLAGITSLDEVSRVLDLYHEA